MDDVMPAPNNSLFAAADYEFRIEELDDVMGEWIRYASMDRGNRCDGYAMRQEVIRLNSDYASKGRTFRLKRRPIGSWQGVAEA